MSQGHFNNDRTTIGTQYELLLQVYEGEEKLPPLAYSTWLINHQGLNAIYEYQTLIEKFQSFCLNAEIWLLFGSVLENQKFSKSSKNSQIFTLKQKI